MSLRDELIVLLVCGAELCFSVTPEQFLRPGKADRPETWFHFIGGNVSTAGITADLEAISGAGISGVQLFHGQFGGKWPGVTLQIKCLSPKWDDVVSHVAKECERLNLRFTMQNCPGWAMAGGPWIKSEDAMRILVWRRVDLRGGGTVDVAIPHPEKTKETWRDYHDIAILAFRTPEGDSEADLIPSGVKSNCKTTNWDNWLKKGAAAVIPASTDTRIEVTFPKPVSLRSIVLPPIRVMAHSWCYAPDTDIRVEHLQGNTASEVASLSLPSSNWQDRQPMTIACGETVGDRYRITFRNAHELHLRGVRFLSAARKENWEGEASWTLRKIVRRNYPSQSQFSWIPKGGVTNVTDFFDLDGRLQWNAPKGKWTVLRIGHVNAGRKNGPAPANATGWECNKLSAEAAEKHFDGYIGRLTEWRKGPIHGKLDGVLLDSWECACQTWSKGLEEEFEKRNGYSLLPWMPALFGYVVDDPGMTSRFLRDWRDTLGKMITENFFGAMARLSHKRGMEISFETAFGDVLTGDIMEYYKYADIPMCEFWRPLTENHVGSDEFKPIFPAASAAHLYGKKRLAAESFTSFKLTWDEKLRDLKHVANQHFADGVTHIIFQAYTHNPSLDGPPPGSSLGSGIGTPFLRKQTWWSAMPEFTSYLTRCGQMLEAGIPVTDVLWYLGDELDHKPAQNTPFPDGFRYDYCNPDALVNRLSVKDGKWRTPEGLSYRLLWFPNSEKMLPGTAEKLLEGIEKGATVVLSSLPIENPSLRGGKEGDLELKKLAEQLRGEPDPQFSNARKIGEGRLFVGQSLRKVLDSLYWAPDVQQSNIRWIHRRDREKEWYFVAPKSPDGFSGKIGFHATGRVELWNPETGDVEPCSLARRKSSVTWIDMDLSPSESRFVVFYPALEENVRIVNVEHDGQPVTSWGTSSCTVNGDSVIAWGNGVYRVTKSDHSVCTNTVRNAMRMALPGTWNVNFPDGRGAPSLVRMSSLVPWKEMNGTIEARSFSGTASYGIDFALRQLRPNQVVYLDLGRVESIATVFVNGRRIKTMWAYPYRADITYAIKPGINRLTLEVTDTWHNRLVFDAGLPEKERRTWTIGGPSKDAPLVESGCLGPVYLYRGVLIQ